MKVVFPRPDSPATCHSRSVLDTDIQTVLPTMMVKAAPRFATILWLHNLSKVVVSSFFLRIPLVRELSSLLATHASLRISLTKRYSRWQCQWDDRTPPLWSRVLMDLRLVELDLLCLVMAPATDEISKSERKGETEADTSMRSMPGIDSIRWMLWRFQSTAHEADGVRFGCRKTVHLWKLRPSSFGPCSRVGDFHFSCRERRRSGSSLCGENIRLGIRIKFHLQHAVTANKFIRPYLLTPEIMSR